MPSERKLQAGLKNRTEKFNASSSYEISQGLMAHRPGSKNQKKAYGTGKDHKKPRR